MPVRCCLLTIWFIDVVRFTKLDTSLLLLPGIPVRISVSTLLEGFIAGWMAMVEDCLVVGMLKVGDGDKFATKALAAAEDTSRVLPTSDFRSTEERRIGVPDSKGAELWETVSTDVDSRYLV